MMSLGQQLYLSNVQALDEQGIWRAPWDSLTAAEQLAWERTAGIFMAKLFPPGANEAVSG